MVLLVTHACEDPLAVLALVWLLPSVGPQVDHEVSLFREGARASGNGALEQFEPGMHCLQVEIKSVAPGEALGAALDGAGDQRGLKVGLFVIFEVLLKFELLSAMFAGEIAQRKL